MKRMMEGWYWKCRHKLRDFFRELSDYLSEFQRDCHTRREKCPFLSDAEFVMVMKDGKPYEILVFAKRNVIPVCLAAIWTVEDWEEFVMKCACHELTGKTPLQSLRQMIKSTPDRSAKTTVVSPLR